MKHSYRDLATGRFVPVPAPTPIPVLIPKSTPPRWVDGRFVSREKWTLRERQASEFTGKGMSTAFFFDEVQQANEYLQAVVNGELGDFLARAYSRVTVRPSGSGWAVKVEYNRPERGQVSP